jgi:hypothetical protein
MQQQKEFKDWAEVQRPAFLARVATGAYETEDA